MNSTLERRRIRRAFWIAPLVSVPALAIVMTIVVAVRGRNMATESAAMALRTMQLFLPGLPLAYALGVGVGLPTYWVLRHNRRLSLLPIVAAATLTGGVGAALALKLLFDAPWDWFLFRLGLPAGAAVGVTFWYVGVRVPKSARATAA